MAEGKPGRPKGGEKYGGRKKGTPNTINADLRSRISAFLDENFDEAVKTWKEIKEPIPKLKLYTDLIKFAVPSLQAVTLENKDKEKDSVEENLRKLAEDI